MAINCGHCHKSHVSVAEVRACSTRKTERPSTSGARKPAQRSTRRGFEFPENPWFQLHLDGEMAYSGFMGPARCIAMVKSEFAEYDDAAIKCGNCGDVAAWWRPTVGAFMCVNCHSCRGGRMNKETGKAETFWTKEA